MVVWRWSQRIVRGSEAGNGQRQGGIGRGVASEVGGGGEVVFREAGAGRTARAAASAADIIKTVVMLQLVMHLVVEYVRGVDLRGRSSELCVRL